MTTPQPLDVAALLAQQAWVERLARGLAYDSSLAQDLAQEAWLRVAERGPDEPGALRGFLAGVVRNLGRSGRRSDARRARREALAARPEALPSAAELVSRAELQRLLVESVLALDDAERTAILLCYFEGLPAEEVARRSGVPGATVRSRVHRGLERLRERLEARMDRNDLLAGLALLAGAPAAGTPVPAATGASGLPWIGWFAMKTLTSVAAGCAALLGLAAGFWFLARDDGSPRASGLARANAAPFVPPEPVAAPLPELAAGMEAGAPRTALEAARPSAPPAAVPATPEAAPARVLARVVDAEGRALAGVAVHCHEELAGTSGALGRLELELVPRGSEELVMLELSHPGHARARRGARLAPGREVPLGDIVLAPAGALRGRVEDERGTRLAGVHLVTTTLENERTDPEELRRLGPLAQEGSVVTESDSRGQFELRDVPLGLVRVWAGTDAFAWSSLGPLEVTREGLDELVLVLRALDSLDRIAGRVLTPEGAPVPAAEVNTWFMAATYGTGDTLTANGEGEFEILLQQRVAHDLTIADPENRWSELYLFAVEPGTLDVELRFEPARWIEVSVHDAVGAPITDFTLGLESATGGNWLHMTPLVEPLGPGRARLRAPNAAFRVTADVAARERGVRGPFDPRALPETLAFELEALAGVRGVVLTSAGAPAAGAEVGLYRVVGEQLVVQKNGFRLVTEGWTDDETTTDADGRFVLYPAPVREGRIAASELVLRATAPGHAPTELAPRTYDARAGVDVEIRLRAGGAIEGRALTAPGIDPTGFVLAFHRGDGDIRTLRLGPDGRYRLDGLTSGPWQVLALDEEMHGNRSSSSSRFYEEGAPPFEDWDCTVTDGEVTRHDVDLTDRAPCRVKGELALAERAPAGWTASLELTDNDVVLASVPLDARGRFELVAPRGGRHRLVLRGPEDGSGRLELREDLDLLPGDREWRLALRPGRLEGTGALGRGTRERFYSYSWLGQAEGHRLIASVRVVPDPDGRFLLPTVPDGPGKIARNDPLPEGQEFAPWEVVSEFEIPPGGVQRVTLSP